MNYHGMILFVKVDKMSVSFAADLGEAVRAAASRAGTPLSSWLAEAAASKLRAEALATFLADWQREHGAITAVELASAENELGRRRQSRVDHPLLVAATGRYSTAAAAARRCISSGPTSSMWVWTLQTWPNGSSIWPTRSP